MKPTLKFLLPDITTANQVAGSLMLASVDNENISVVAKPGTDLGQLQAANIIESTQIIHDDRDDGRGILVGVALGLLVGTFIHYIQPKIAASMEMHWITVAVISMGMAILGIKFFGPKLKKYKDKIEAGAILLIVTTPFQRMNEIRLIVNKSYLKY